MHGQYTITNNLVQCVVHVTAAITKHTARVWEEGGVYTYIIYVPVCDVLFTWSINE